jgi:DNA-binding transcriptional ArsR family regulator
MMFCQHGTTPVVAKLDLDHLGWRLQLSHLRSRAAFPAATKAAAVVSVMRQGAATLAVLDYLRSDGSFRREGEIMRATGKKHGAVSFALLVLRGRGLVMAVPDTVRNSRYLRYKAVPE